MKKNILLQPMKLTKKMHDFEIVNDNDNEFDNNENIFNSFKYIEPKEEEKEKDLMTFEKTSDFLFDILMNDILQTNTVIKGPDKNKDKNKDKVNPYAEFELKKGKSLPIIDSYELPSLVTKRNCLEKKKKKSIPKNIKKLVWTKYIGQEIIRHKCLCCKTVTIENTFFECGHVVSERDGGTLEISNLRPICGECNRSMGTMNMIEYVKTYGLFIG